MQISAELFLISTQQQQLERQHPQYKPANHHQPRDVLSVRRNQNNLFEYLMNIKREAARELADAGGIVILLLLFRHKQLPTCSSPGVSLRRLMNNGFTHVCIFNESQPECVFKIDLYFMWQRACNDRNRISEKMLTEMMSIVECIWLIDQCCIQTISQELQLF